MAGNATFFEAIPATRAVNAVGKVAAVHYNTTTN